jgi:diacylglycerol kinase (ATP)
MPLAIIYNPTSAAGKSRRQFDLAQRTLEGLGVDFEMFQTEYFAHAIPLARELATKGYTVVGAGGDGTCNEVLNGVIQSGTNRPVGFIPIGSGNDIPGAVGYRPDVVRACEILAAGNVTRCDVGVVTSAEGAPRYFVGVGSQGFDAEVTQRTNAGKKRLSGTWNYVASVVKTVFKFRKRAVRVVMDDATWEGVCNLVAVGNGPSYGGWMYICPDAGVHDGVLDVTIIDMGKVKLLVDFSKLYDKSLLPHPNITTFRSTRVRIEMLDAADTPYLAQVDGEIVGDLPVEYKILPDFYPFLAPECNEADEWWAQKYRKKPV